MRGTLIKKTIHHLIFFGKQTLRMVGMESLC